MPQVAETALLSAKTTQRKKKNYINNDQNILNPGIVAPTRAYVKA